MALSFIKGPNVKDWTRAQRRDLEHKVNVNHRNVRPYEEVLWREFEQDFMRMFTDSTSQQDAYNRLKNLTMTNDDLDSYINAHRNLIARVGWNLEGDGSVEKFRSGLKRQLHLAILRQGTLPTTFQEWVNAARREQSRWALMKASGLIGNQFGGRQGQWKNALGKGQGHQNKSKDPNAMDVDNIRLNPLTDDERKKLSAEGRCFRCRQQGHMSRNCPKKQAGQSNQSQNTPRTYQNQTKARNTEIVDDRDNVSDDGTEATVATTSTQKTYVNMVKIMPDDVVKALEKLSKEQRGEVLDQILLRGEDF
jgi:hypothetical protein